MNNVLNYMLSVLICFAASCDRSDESKSIPETKSPVSQSVQRKMYEVYKQERAYSQESSPKVDTKIANLALVKAVEDNDLALAKGSLNNGANINYKITEDGRTPLHIATILGRIEMAAMLLEKNPDINIKDDDGCTPLHLAAGKGFYDITKLLLKHGADPKAYDKYNRTPLYLTRGMSSAGHKKTADLLKQYTQ